MLLPRVITALIFGALIIAATFNLSDSHFFLMTAVFIAACSWEWSSLINIETSYARCLFVFFMLISFVISFWLPLGAILVGSVCWWVFVVALLVTYPKTRHVWAGKKYYGMFMGVTSILPAGLAINVLKHYNQGAFVVLYALMLVILADSAAYFAGKSFGRRPLALKLSPKKTIEGLIGGLLVTFVFSVIGAMYFHLNVTGSVFFVFVSMVSVVISVVGDLYISMLKRERGVKDAGKLLPGHGGILDRLDGINAALPIFTFGLMLLTWWFV